MGQVSDASFVVLPSDGFESRESGSGAGLSWQVKWSGGSGTPGVYGVCCPSRPYAKAIIVEEEIVLTTAEQRVMRTFRRFLMTPGQMLCFYGPNLKQNLTTLERLTDRDFLVKEKFQGGYSLTLEGYAAMNSCE